MRAPAARLIQPRRAHLTGGGRDDRTDDHLFGVDEVPMPPLLCRARSRWATIEGVYDEVPFHSHDSDSHDPGDIGSRIDPMLARSWLLVSRHQITGPTRQSTNGTTNSHGVAVKAALMRSRLGLRRIIRTPAPRCSARRSADA